MKKFFTFWALTFAMLAVALWASVFGSLAYVLSIFGLIPPIENAAKGIFLIAHDFFTWAEKYHYGVKLESQPIQDPMRQLRPEEQKAIEEEVNARWENRKRNKFYMVYFKNAKGDLIQFVPVQEHCKHCAIATAIEYSDKNLPEIKEQLYITAEFITDVTFTENNFGVTP